MKLISPQIPKSDRISKENPQRKSKKAFKIKNNALIVELMRCTRAKRRAAALLSHILLLLCFVFIWQQNFIIRLYTQSGGSLSVALLAWKARKCAAKVRKQGLPQYHTCITSLRTGSALFTTLFKTWFCARRARSLNHVDWTPAVLRTRWWRVGLHRRR